jgi:DNA topoisomerase IA/ssDNA-binding Zn-finger/Zn-ribbon topoisomerase 1
MKVLLFIDSEAKARTLVSQSDLEIEEIVLQESPLEIRHDSAIKNLHMGERGFHFSPRSSLDNTFLQQLEKNPDREVIFAFDNDQRGDYWSWMINGYLSSVGRQGRVCKRLRLQGLRRDLISGALDGADTIPFADGAAYYIRTLFNGYLVCHLQRLLGTASGPGKLPLDYLSLTILFLLVDRHNMTAPGVARAGLQLQVKVSDGNGQFVVNMKKGPEVVADGLFANAAQVKNISEKLTGQPFVVEEIRGRSATVRYVEPLNLSNILHEGKRLFVMSPGDIWDSLVKLYHGVELDGVWTGLISDPYGNANKASGDILDQIRVFLKDTYGENEVAAGDCNPNVILPLHPNVTGDALRGVVAEKTVQLYELIRSRALMSQMAEPQGDEVEVDVRSGDFIFTCQGIRVVKPGCIQENSQNEYNMLQPLSSQLQAGQSLELVGMGPQAAAAPSANLYTLPALLEELQDFSIVHSSTLPVALQKMIEGEYVRVLADGTLLCLENTKKVVETINKVFPKMQGLNLSAYFEQTVTEVISGRKDIDFALKQFNQNFQMQGVSLLKKTAPSPVIPRGKRSKNIIKSPIEEKTGKPESSVVSQHEEEKSESLENEILDSEASQVQEGQDEIILPETVYNVGEEAPELDVIEEEAVEQDVVDVADSCAVDEEVEDVPVVAVEEENEPESPEQKAIEEEQEEEPPEPQQQVSSDDVVEEKVQALAEALEPEEKVSSEIPEGREDIQCPLCGNDYLLVKQTSSDKIYYECSVSNCEFIAWARPHGVFCPQCKSPYLVEKKGADGKMLQCPKAGCRYEQLLTNEDSSAPPAKKKKVLVKRKKGSSGSGAKKRKVVVRRRRG